MVQLGQMVLAGILASFLMASSAFGPVIIGTGCSPKQEQATAGEKESSKRSCIVNFWLVIFFLKNYLGPIANEYVSSNDAYCHIFLSSIHHSPQGSATTAVSRVLFHPPPHLPRIQTSAPTRARESIRMAFSTVTIRTSSRVCSTSRIRDATSWRAASTSGGPGMATTPAAAVGVLVES